MREIDPALIFRQRKSKKPIRRYIKNRRDSLRKSVYYLQFIVVKKQQPSVIAQPSGARSSFGKQFIGLVCK
jgi:hypothetical protein